MFTNLLSSDNNRSKGLSYCKKNVHVKPDHNTIFSLAKK